MSPVPPLDPNFSRPPRWAGALKPLCDFALVLVTAPVWAPLCWLIALGIWLEDQHHPLFRHARVGRNGRLFYAYKFRTLATGAEELLQAHLAADPVLRWEWEQRAELRHDPRITRMGRWLLRTSFDELPQLVNVLRGEMALVGPRPLPLYQLHRLTRQVQRLRSRVRPGITGLWQVCGRNEAGTVGMERFDPYYVRKWSAGLDAAILLRTIRVVIVGPRVR